MTGQKIQHKQWSSLPTFLGMALPIYTDTQIWNIMSEAQWSITRAKLAITRNINHEKDSRKNDIKRHYKTELKATPKWLCNKRKQDEATIPGTIMYMITDYSKPLLRRDEPIVEER